MKKALLLCCLLLGAKWVLAGETETIQAPAPITASATPAADPTWNVELTSSYTSSARIMKAGYFGSQAVVEYELQAYKDIKLFQNYFLQLGFDLERFNFSRSNSFFPYAMTSLAGELVFAYWDGDDFYPVLRFEPGLYYTRAYITKNSFDVPIRFTPGLKVNDNLYLIGGFSLDVYSNPIVFPVAGVNWKINDQWNLRAVFPRPRFSYIPNKKWEFFVQGDLNGDSFRNGPTNYRFTNNAVLQYYYYRAGLGFNYEPVKGFEIEAVAGWNFKSEYDYIRAGPIYDVKPAPYVWLDLKWTIF
jgi:hypothetical protein